MTSFIQEHWLALVSLIVALIGGVPGIVTVIQEWRSRPKLAAYLHHLIPLNTTNVLGESFTGLILHIAIGNKGKEPLVPLVFQLECKIRGTWFSFQTASIPEGFKVSGPDVQYSYTNVEENDIQKRQKSITRESPVNGYLFFVSKEINFDDLQTVFMRMPIKLKCRDLFGQVYEFILNDDLVNTAQLSPIHFSKNGVKVSKSAVST